VPHLNKSLARFNKNPFHQGFSHKDGTIHLCDFIRCLVNFVFQIVHSWVKWVLQAYQQWNGFWKMHIILANVLIHFYIFQDNANCCILIYM